MRDQGTSEGRAARIAALARGALVVGLLLAARAALAEEEQVHLQFSAPPECGDRARFASSVAGRTRKARWLERSEGLRVFDVSVLRAEERWQGLVRIRDAAGTWSSRQIAGNSCEELIDALALVTALAIDPQADTSPGAGAASGRPNVAPASATPLALAPSNPPGLAVAFAPSDPPTLLASPLPSAGPGPAPRTTVGSLRWRWGDGVQLLGVSGLSPGLSAVAAAFVDVAAQSESILSPSFRLALSYLPNRVIDVDAGQAKFWRLAAHPSACPVGLELHAIAWIRPCIGMEIGVLHGSGRVPPLRSADTLWLAAALAARLELNPVPWALVELQGELGVPFVRPEYYFEPATSITRVSPAYGTVGGALGVRFP